MVFNSKIHLVTSKSQFLSYVLSVAFAATIFPFTNSFANMALVIGVTDYKESPLINPLNDVNIISSALKGKGWRVTELKNPSSEQLKQELRDFFSSESSGKPLIVYFSGHGLQYRGENYLLPKDANSRSSTILKSALSITELGYFSKDHTGPKIFIVDACRSSPLGRETIAVSSGLNSQFAPPNSLIAYATSPGDFALDGPPGGNSPYASSLAWAITRSNTIEAVFKDTRIETLRRTSGKQVPWESSSLFSAVTFNVTSLQSIHTPAAAAAQNSNTQHQQSVNNLNTSAFVPTPHVQIAAQVVQTHNVDRPSQQSQSNSNSSLAGIQVVSNSVPNSLMQPNNLGNSFSAAYDELIRVIQVAPLSSFIRRDGKSPTERDRSDFLMTVQIRKEMAGGKTPRGVVYSLIDTLQRGVMHPFCKKGVGVDRECGDMDRWLTIQPNLALSLKLAKMAMEKNIASDRLALHYQNGWGVDKDLLKAYELYMVDEKLGGEYFWTDINRMVQMELIGLGHSVKADGDFGSESCKALALIIGPITCSKVVSRTYLEKLVSMKGILRL